MQSAIRKFVSTSTMCPNIVSKKFMSNSGRSHKIELQASAGRIEAEATGSVSIPTKASSFSANDATAIYTASLPASNEDGQCKKGLLKWKGLKKIDRIYGDWLDDLPLVNSLPRKVE